MLPPTGRLLAVDWGDVRIGLALSDESQVIATPLETLVRRPGKRFPMPRFLELVAQHAPVGVVVGLPLTGEGEEGASGSPTITPTGWCCEVSSSSRGMGTRFPARRTRVSSGEARV